MDLKEADIQILGRLLELEGQKLSPEKAQLVLSINFSPEDRKQIEELGEKSNEGTLTGDEKDLYFAYMRVINLLTVLQSRARLALRKLGKTA
jgi:hypothetical protein